LRRRGGLRPEGEKKRKSDEKGHRLELRVKIRSEKKVGNSSCRRGGFYRQEGKKPNGKKRGGGITSSRRGELHHTSNGIARPNFTPT